MKVSELKQFLNQLDDDFEIFVKGQKKVAKQELNKRTYPFPYDYFHFDIEVGDIGYSEKVAILDIDLDKPQD